jgi:hypothetical protein
VVVHTANRRGFLLPASGRRRESQYPSRVPIIIL